MNDLELYLSPAMQRARAIAAKRLGLVLEQYESLRKARVKWCSGPGHRAPGAWVPFDDFGPHAAKGDGKQSWCCSCVKIAAGQRRKAKVTA